MHRLRTVAADADDVPGFVSPILIDKWVRHLRGIKHFADPSIKMSNSYVRNIGYRIQLLEFLAALLLGDYEAKTTSQRKTSELHGTVSAMLIQQFAVVATTVLEGIGSHLVRASYQAENRSLGNAVKISPDEWMSAIANQKYQTDQYPYARQELIEPIKSLASWRDYSFMDSVKEDRELHIELFSYDSCFIPTYRTFNDAMTSLGTRWPKKSCLNDKRLLGGREKPFFPSKKLPPLPQ